MQRSNDLHAKALPKQDFVELQTALCADWVNGDETANLAAVLEADYAVDFGEEGVIFAAAYVCAGLERCPALTDEDGAAGNSFATEALHAEPLCI